MRGARAAGLGGLAPGTRAAAARDSRQAAARRLIFEVLALKTEFRDIESRVRAERRKFTVTRAHP